MLAQIRTFAKSPFASGLLGLLVLSFAVFGIQDVFRHGVGARDAVVQSGPRAVSSREFRSMFDRYLKGLAEQNGGQAPSIEEAANQGLDARALNDIAYEEAMAAETAKLGVRPDDKLIAEELSHAKRFFDPLTRRFDKAAYAQFLRDNNVSAEELEGNLRDQIAQRHLLTGLVAGMQAPKAYTALQAAFNGESRGFSFITLTPNMVPVPPKPTDAEMQAFLKANAQTRPEMRTVSLVRFSAALLASTITASEDEVKKRFGFEKDSLSVPEKRSLVQIPVASAAQAANAVARLKAGTPAAVVAKALGVAPLVYTDAPRIGVADKGVGDVAFAMAAGEVRGPVQGALGTVVVQVSAITPGHEATLEAVRPKLEAEVKQAAANEKAEALVQKYDDARSGGSNLAEAAKAAGVEVIAVPPFYAQGMDGQGRKLPVPQKLIQTAFTLPQGGESETLQAGPGEYYAIRIDKVTPPSVVSLEEVREPLTRRLMVQALLKALTDKAQALAVVAKTQGLEAAAKSVGASVEHAAGVTRAAAGGAQSVYAPELIGRAFAAKPGDVVVAAEAKRLAVTVAKVEGLAPADPTALALASRAAFPAASGGLQNDLALRLRDAARLDIKPRIDPARARSALGLEPLDAKAAAKPAPGAKPAA